MIVGPLIAVLSFVCSIGNVPLAAVLWSGGISFAGVMAFIFADLIVLPIIVAYRKYYGTGLRAADHGADVRDDGDRGPDRSTASSALAGLIPTRPPSREDIFGSVELDYKLVLNVVALAVFAALFYLTVRRGATDPVCGMRVDRSKALRMAHAGRTYFFCSEHCRAQFEADPDEYTGRRPAAAGAHATGHAH